MCMISFLNRAEQIYPDVRQKGKKEEIFKKSLKESYMSNNSVPANAPTWAVASSSQDSSTVSYTILIQILKSCTLFKFRG